jgi:hypothetical protein
MSGYIQIAQNNMIPCGCQPMKVGRLARWPVSPFTRK